MFQHNSQVGQGISSMLAFIQNNRERLGLDNYGLPEELSALVITPRFRSSSHVLFAIFPEGKSRPVLVVKVPRMKGESPSINREATNLRTVQSSRLQGFESIPSVVALEEVWDRPILVETALVGEPMDPPTIRRNPKGCCIALMEWLIDVQLATCVTPDPDRIWFEKLVKEPFEYMREKFPISEQEEHFLNWTWEQVKQISDAKIPLVFEHGDLSHPNVMLLDDGKVGVVDWEQADPQGLPGVDLFFFLTYVAFARYQAREKDNYLTAFKSAFWGRSAWAIPHINSYAERLKLPRSTLTPLFVLSWFRYIINQLKRLGYIAPAEEKFESTTATWLRGNRYYSLWQYAVKHAAEIEWD